MIFYRKSMSPTAPAVSCVQHSFLHLTPPNTCTAKSSAALSSPSIIRKHCPPSSLHQCARVNVVSCPSRNNLRKIHLVTLRTFLGLLHMSAGFQRGWRWPYMDILTSTWLQFPPISIHTQALGCQWAAGVIGDATI